VWRFRDIVTAITAVQGGLDELAEARLQLLRLAALAVHADTSRRGSFGERGHARARAVLLDAAARDVTYKAAETPKSDLYRDMLPLVNARRIFSATAGFWRRSASDKSVGYAKWRTPRAIRALETPGGGEVQKFEGPKAAARAAVAF
jgi:hypothetical protein